METLDARGNLSALNRFDFSVKDFLCEEGASLSYTVRPRMSPGVGEMDGWDPSFSPQVIVTIPISHTVYIFHTKINICFLATG